MASAILRADFPATTTKIPTPVLCAYAVTLATVLTMYHTVAEKEFSSVLTAAVIVQCLGIGLLCIQVLSSGSSAGVSVGGLTLDAMSVGLRLSSTTWLHGYLPMDATGECLYQLVDIASFGMLLFLLHRVLVVQRSSYQALDDSFDITKLVVGSFVLAALFHADMDDHPLFDIFWMTGLLCGVVSVLPQLWLTMQTGGQAQALMGHYIAATAMGRILSGYFMWEARYDITCSYWIEGFEHARYAILFAHVVHLLLLVDFALNYAKSLAQKGLSGAVDLTQNILV